MKKISFAKMSGAGNDFIVFDSKINPGLELTVDSIRRLCNRHEGIGGDGVLFISDSQGYHFEMKYFNADGSGGTLCGNGARCALRYAWLSGRLGGGSHAVFKSDNIEFSGDILDGGLVKFNLNQPRFLRHDIFVEAAGHNIKAQLLDTGSPHVVIHIDDIKPVGTKNDSGRFYSDLSELPVFDLGREIRYSGEFAPGGVNVNFIDVRGSELYIRTYERGVENETLACGTGSVAAALIANAIYLLKPPVTVVTWSGVRLFVDFSVQDDLYSGLSLSGPAEITFTGEFYSSLYF